jgi:serine protease Do
MPQQGNAHCAKKGLLFNLPARKHWPSGSQSVYPVLQTNYQIHLKEYPMRIHILLLAALLAFSSSAAATDLSRAFKKVDSAVVVIQTKESQQVISEHGIRETSSGGLGSGIIISPDGQVLTAAHVVHNADEIAVSLSDGQSMPARIISSSVLADVALIQLEGEFGPLNHVPLSDSDKVSIGEVVFVIGNPYGLTHTLTVGNLSGRRIQGGDEALLNTEFLQTDAAVNQGNSGGPLFTKDGKLIGIVSFISSQSGGSEGLGFAASSNMIKEEILNRPHIWSGMEYVPLQGKIAEAFNIGKPAGLLVQHVAKNSPAEALGIKAGYIPISIGDEKALLGGDVIVEVGGEQLYLTKAGRQRVLDYLGSLKSGDRISVTVLRDGKLKELGYTID